MLLVLVVFLYVGIPSLCVELTCHEWYLYWSCSYMWEFPVSVLSWLVMNVTCIGRVPICGNSQSLCWADLSWMLLVLVVFLYGGIPSLCVELTCHECYLYWLCSYMWEFPVSVLSWLVMNVTCIGCVPICRWWIMTECAQSPPWQVACYGNLWVCHWHGETSFVKAKSISCRILLILITC